MADLRTSGLPLQIEYDEANNTLKVPATTTQVEYQDIPDLRSTNLQTFVEYIEESLGLQNSQHLSQIEYDESGSLIELSELIAQVEYPYLDTIEVTQETEYNIWGLINITQTITYSIIHPFTPKKFWTSDVQILIYSIIESLSPIQEIIYSILEQTPIKKKQVTVYSLLPTDIPLEISQPQYQILLDGEDVSDKILSCKVSYSKSSFVGTVDITWKDWSIFNLIDPSDNETNFMMERLEVLTKTTGDWVSQGKFFLEKRDTRATPNEILPTSWGRNKPALLSEPYSKTITKTWETQTTAKTITEEVINGLVTLDWQIMDYPVMPGVLSANKERPIAIITKLANALGGIVITDKTGQLRVIYKWTI